MVVGFAAATSRLCEAAPEPGRAPINVGAVTTTAPTPRHALPLALHAARRRCSLVPGTTLAVVRVQKDTSLRNAPAGIEPMSASGVRAGPLDSLLATSATAMPAARVRLMQLDSNTRALLAREGIRDSQPAVFIRAAPYRADCATIRWTDTVPFAVPGEVGYVRATLAPREFWINGVPVLIIPDGWNYPYPRRRGLAYGAASDAKLASAAAVFSFNAVREVPPGRDAAGWAAADSTWRARSLAWARANAADAEFEPIRAAVRQAVLQSDWRAAERLPSRLRGTYRVDFETGDQRTSWYIRTHDRPGYSWRGADSLQRTADLIARPFVSGYRLVGYAAGASDASYSSDPRELRRATLVWLATDDRPTTPGNDARLALSGILEFQMAAAPEAFWDDLESLIPRQSARDSTMMARMNPALQRSNRQPQLPLRVQFDGAGGVRADTTLRLRGRTLRAVLQRIDTLSIRRPF